MPQGCISNSSSLPNSPHDKCDPNDPGFQQLSLAIGGSNLVNSQAQQQALVGTLIFLTSIGGYDPDQPLSQSIGSGSAGIECAYNIQNFITQYGVNSNVVYSSGSTGAVTLLS